MTAVNKSDLSDRTNAIVVPVNTIQNREQRKIVYVAETKGNKTVARKKVVGSGRREEGWCSEINPGLNKGDKQATVGFQSPSDGENIKI